MTNTPSPVGFKIIRIARDEEHVSADSVEAEGNPPQYVFRKNGNVVRKLFVHALETEPHAVFPQTAESKAAWKSFKQKANAANQMPQLDRSV